MQSGSSFTASVDAQDISLASPHCSYDHHAKLECCAKKNPSHAHGTEHRVLTISMLEWLQIFIPLKLFAASENDCAEGADSGRWGILEYEWDINCGCQRKGGTLLMVSCFQYMYIYTSIMACTWVTSPRCHSWERRNERMPCVDWDAFSSSVFHASNLQIYHVWYMSRGQNDRNNDVSHLLLRGICVNDESS